MVKETNLEGNIVFKCEKCGWLYRYRGMAEKCQRWCEKHKSCNLEYAKFAIKLNKLMKN
ncbi:MAG: hypothetical protein WD876_02390 [Candidatus Pacearchaeota archaeon]